MTGPSGPTHGPKNKKGVVPTPDDVRRLHAAGESRNNVARLLGCSKRQVDNVAAEIGVSWSAEATRDAAEVHTLSAEIERAELAAKFRLLAEDSLDRAMDEADNHERRRLVSTAAEASRADLAIWAHRQSQVTERGGLDGGAFQVLEWVGDGFQELDDVGVEVLDPAGRFECSGED